MSIDLLIIRNRNKLERLIEENADYKLILKQSRKLDVYINKKMALVCQTGVSEK